MSNDSMAKTGTFQARFMDKLMMGMPLTEYVRTLVTPFNVAAAAILAFGLPLIVIRFTQGLASVTHASNEYPWSILLGWGLFAAVVGATRFKWEPGQGGGGRSRSRRRGRSAAA